MMISTEGRLSSGRLTGGTGGSSPNGMTHDGNHHAVTLLAEAIGLVTHPTGAGAAAAAAVPGYAMSRLLGRAMTDPKTAATAVKALQTGQRIAPAAAAQAGHAAFKGTSDSFGQQ
jgi:hypothetical protein